MPTLAALSLRAALVICLSLLFAPVNATPQGAEREPGFGPVVGPARAQPGREGSAAGPQESGTAPVAPVPDEEPAGASTPADSGSSSVVPSGEAGSGSEWEARVKARAQQRWDALIEGRLETAYELLSPATREALPYKVYALGVQGVGRWKEAEVVNATCDNDRCEVATDIVISIRLLRMDAPIVTSTRLNERWLIDREAGQVWFVPNN